MAIAIPLYDEAEILESTVNYFSTLANNTNVNIYFALCSKESDTALTEAMVTIQRKRNPLIHIVKPLASMSSKAAQINHTVGMIRGLYDYVAIFDADSRPEQEGIEYVLYSDRTPDLYQMPSLYDEHIRDMPQLSKANTLYQSRWTLCFETPRWIRWYENRSKPPLMYLVGHGIFIHKSYALLFSKHTITEDLDFGYKSSSSHASLAIVPYFDHCTVPKKVGANITQASRWYHGEITLYKLYPQLKNIRNQPIYSLFLLLKRYYQILEWAFGPVIILLSLAASIILQSAILCILSIIGVFIYIVGVHEETRKLLGMSPKVYFYLPIKCIINSFGPLLYMWNAIRRKRPEFIKTKR